MSLARSNETETRTSPLAQVVHFAFANRQPQLSATVVIADAFRSAVLSALHNKVRANDSLLLSGHNADGTPDQENRHAYYLPMPAGDGSQRLTGILVVCPVAQFSAQEMAALRAVTTLRWNGPSTKLALELVETDDRAVATIAFRWASTTPYVPIRRFWGTHGKHHLVPEKQLEEELRRTGVAELTAIEIQPWCKVRIRRKSSHSAGTASHPAIRLGYRAVFSTAKPILGPVALGHSCHFGLGQFIPVPNI